MIWMKIMSTFFSNNVLKKLKKTVWGKVINNFLTEDECNIL